MESNIKMKSGEKMAKNINMLSGPLLPKMIAYAIPIILQGLLQTFYNAADMIVVGQFCGSKSLAAVGSTTSLVHLMINLLLGLSVGSRVLVAQEFGAKDREEMSRSSHTAVFIALVFGSVLGIIAFFLSKPILLLMDSPKDVIELSSIYLKIYFLGMPASLMMNFGTSILGAIGDTRKPTYIVAVSGLINVGLNIVLVLLGLDVAGVAIATITSQYFSATVILILLMRTNEGCKISFKKLRLHFDKLKKILSIGIPSSIQSCIFSFSNIIIQSTVNSFGSTIVAGAAASANIEALGFTAMAGMSQASLTFTGQNVGAGNNERLPKIFKTAFFAQFVFIFTIGLGFVFFGKFLIGFYNGDPAVIDVGVQLNCIKGPFLFFCAISDVCSFSMRGLGKSLPPMVISIVCICGIRLLFVLGGSALGFIDPQIQNTINFIFISYPVSWGLSAIIQFIAYKKTLKTFLLRPEKL